MARHLQWPERVGEQVLPTRDERVHQRVPGSRIRTDPAFHGARGALEHGSRAVLERVDDRGGWMDPFQAVLVQRQAAEDRRTDAAWMDRGAAVVPAPRKV